MSQSFVGTGGFGVVPSGASSGSPAIGYTANVNGSVAADGLAINAVAICHTGTSDGSTPSTDWLNYQVVGSNGEVQRGVLLPGQERAIQGSRETNNIAVVNLWGSAANSAGAPAGNICALVSPMIRR